MLRDGLPEILSRISGNITMSTSIPGSGLDRLHCKDDKDEMICSIMFAYRFRSFKPRAGW